MERRRVRLGDVIDDYCTRCRLIMNHGIVGMVAEDVRKVRCNTCMTEHLYKHGKVPTKKRREHARLFEEVLRGLGRTPDAPEPAVDQEPPDDDTTPAAETPGSGAGPDSIEAAEADGALPGPETPAAPERSPEEVHGVRRKLYTIRRHSGGKAPVGGDSGGGTPGR